MTQHESPFFSLPLEIRQHIYRELLVASSDEPVMLWHDRKGREKSISIQPQILRVCKHINVEATPLLYERNKFSVSLTSTESHSCIRRKIEKSQALIRHEPTKQARHFEQPGLLLPSSFQRLAHLEVIIAPDSVWANARACDFWSGTGDLFMQLLQLLADEAVSERLPKKKRLSITVQKTVAYGFGWVLFPRLETGKKWLRNSNRRSNGEKQMVDKICPLVERIAKMRDVHVYEVLKERYRENPDDPLKSRTTIREVALENMESL
ncbi:MAG: hypothetical protein Q9169_003950 [Polycauliona sp. 2 TL-2023]